MKHYLVLFLLLTFLHGTLSSASESSSDSSDGDETPTQAHSDPESYQQHAKTGHREKGSTIYRQWRDGPGGGKELLHLDERMQLAISRNLRPAVAYKNDLAPANACSIEELKNANIRLTPGFDGVLESYGFKAPQWVQMVREDEQDHKYYQAGNGDRRNLRAGREEEDRELWCSCPECPGGWWCHMVCDSGYCRRRLNGEDGDDGDDGDGDIRDDSDNLTLDIKTFPQLEATLKSVEKLIVIDCEELLSRIGTDSPRMCKSCREAFIGAKCSAEFDMAHVARVAAEDAV